ncbi:MAG: hypothetical protein AUJ74_04940 [Candidatus Omnitrophica bacterium CG1_02_44_16]|nr:MAG: hypothetical protein AUJ74_04940 [Candidatus Omnitrophica bacterium CG1_02_44_16]PIY82058.1 MAG: hypothetical protein COY78_08455 [Candidatus Omnitrophica bacterium CG_4_10_14_0_8_um_filter_44_12]PIZ83128.1 MAG: hypothetical protein COX96_08970 [Candidatus Omnitrophica bacterium CG_4_10_14_0_2_um_filter_44_9]
MAKVLFFNPPSRKNVYLNTNVSVGAPSYPSLTLATLASHLVAEHEVKIVDLDVSSGTSKELLEAVKDFHADVVAASAKTHDYFIVRDLMMAVKERYPSVLTIVGGVHVTACPDEASAALCFDIIVVGEGDTVLWEILSAKNLENVPGIIIRKGQDKDIVRTAHRGLIDNLDDLPYPAWHLFDIKQYKNSRLSSRRNPVGHIETSRGCLAQCNFCSKVIFGSKPRVKSPKRVVDEMAYMLDSGFKEIHVADDSFTQDIQRAKEVCREILRRGLRFPWALISGIRVNMVDLEFLSLAKNAGCWQVGFGLETGDQDVLNRINKKITLKEAENAIHLAKKAGLDTFGFFIFALAGETEVSMERTIAFAKRLPLDTAKFDICIPYPGTRYYSELKEQGRIKSYDWSKYVCHQTESPLFDHPNIPWDKIELCYKRAFREFYLRPSYFFRRFWRSLRRHDILYDIKYFLKTKW